MRKSLIDSFEAAKVRNKVTGQWNALSAEQQRLICRIVGFVCLVIGMMSFVVFIRSLT